MTKRNVLIYPDPHLRLKAKPVEQFDQTLQTIIDDMFETMYEDKGIGLAATQIDIHQQILVIDLLDSDQTRHTYVLINPEITKAEGSCKNKEGCLSLPGIEGDVKRAEKIRIKAFDRHGKPFEIEAKGLLAICIQHELDHLNGILFIDHLSPLKRQFAKKKMEKWHKTNDTV